MLGTSFQTYSRKWWHTYHIHTVDGWNPANQLRLVVFPIIYRVSYIPGAAGFQPPTVPLLVNKHQNDKSSILCLYQVILLNSHFFVITHPAQGNICVWSSSPLNNFCGVHPKNGIKNIQNDRKSTPQFIRNAGSGIIPVNHHMRYSISFKGCPPPPSNGGKWSFMWLHTG